MEWFTLLAIFLICLVISETAAKAEHERYIREAQDKLRYTSFQCFFANFRDCLSSTDPVSCLPALMKYGTYSNFSALILPDGKQIYERWLSPEEYFEYLRTAKNPNNSSSLSLLEAFNTCFRVSTRALVRQDGAELYGKDFKCYVERTVDGYWYLSGFGLGC